MMMIPNTMTASPLVAGNKSVLCPTSDSSSRDNNMLAPGGEKLLPALIQQIAKASTTLQNKTWSHPATFTSSVSDQVSAGSPTNHHSTVTMCKLDTNTALANQVLEHQLASHLLERYSQQLTPNSSCPSTSTASHPAFCTSPLSTKQLLTTNNTILNNTLTTNNSILNNTLTNNNSLLSNHFLNNSHLASSPQHTSQPLILPRYNTNQITPANSPRLIMKQDEGNSRRLRWKEEHGKALISIWKEKYPQVRSAKKIKEKHAVWHDIGEAYNKLCVKYDWPPRSTEQVKIKVKNCIDEYKQTIKYNQEYKTCPYFQDIDDIFGMSDPEKSAELQNHQTSPIPELNSDNIYWSGTSLPTQVKKRKLNISCKPVDGGEEGKENAAKRASPRHHSNSPGNQPPHHDVYLLNLPNDNQTGTPTPHDSISKTKSEGPGKSSDEPRYEVKLGGTGALHNPCPRVDASHQFKCEVKSPTNLEPSSAISIPQFSSLLKQIHERELKMVEMYHKIDTDRRNSYLQRERERYEAEYQLEESRQKFLGNIVGKLINVIKDQGLSSKLDKDDLLPEPTPSVAPTFTDQPVPESRSSLHHLDVGSDELHSDTVPMN